MKHYHAILMDPPWLERGGGQIKRGADRHYSLMNREEIVSAIRNSGFWYPSSKHCHLYCWVTNNFLPDGLWVVKELGFKYKTLITWAKTRIGLGQYFRGQTEHVLFATSGKARVPPPSRRSSTLLGADPLEKRIHSRKPVALYSVIEEVSEGPYLEMFARSKREGWDSWGNETDKF